MATKQRSSGFTDKVRGKMEKMKGKAEKMMSSRNKTGRKKEGARGKRA